MSHHIILEWRRILVGVLLKGVLAAVAKSSFGSLLELREFVRNLCAPTSLIILRGMRLDEPWRSRKRVLVMLVLVEVAVSKVVRSVHVIIFASIGTKYVKSTGGVGPK